MFNCRLGKVAATLGLIAEIAIQLELLLLITPASIFVQVGIVATHV